MSNTDRIGHKRVLCVLITFGLIGWAAALAAPQAANQDPATAPATPAAKPKMETAKPESFPDVVARVNDSSIGKEELLTRVESVRGQMHIPDGALPIDIYRTVLDDMVDLELLYQSSRSNHLEATPQEIDNGLAQLKAQYPTEEAFQSQLDSESITIESLRVMLGKDISIQKLVDGPISEKVIITDDAKRQFYSENESTLEEPEHLRLRHILIRVPSDATEEQRAQAREKIEGLRKQVTEGGADFATLARENSEDPGSRDDGGELTIMEGQTAPPFEEAAFKLAPGTISEVVETSFGYHIIQLLERVPARKLPFEEISDRIGEYLKQQEVRREVQAEVESLRSKASIAIFI